MVPILIGTIIANQKEESAPRQTATLTIPPKLSQPAPARSAPLIRHADPIFGIYDNFVPNYKVTEIEFNEPGPMQRVRAHIRVPAGMSRESLGQNIRHAIRMFRQTKGANGIMVFASVKGKDPITSYLGRGEFAPYGDFLRVEEGGPLEVYRVKVELLNSNSEYVEDKPK